MSDRITNLPLEKDINMDKPGAERKVELSYLEKSITYEAYKKRIDDLPCRRKKSTGPQQSGSPDPLFAVERPADASRMEKTIQVLPEVKDRMIAITRPQTWLILTEGWCGDAAHSLPVMKALADLNPIIRIRILLRDENPELMDRYLTNGVSRSIPKLIAVDPASGTELFHPGDLVRQHFRRNSMACAPKACPMT